MILIDSIGFFLTCCCCCCCCTCCTWMVCACDGELCTMFPCWITWPVDIIWTGTGVCCTTEWLLVNTVPCCKLVLKKCPGNAAVSAHRSVIKLLSPVCNRKWSAKASRLLNAWPHSLWDFLLLNFRHCNDEPIFIKWKDIPASILRSCWRSLWSANCYNSIIRLTTDHSDRLLLMMVILLLLSLLLMLALLLYMLNNVLWFGRSVNLSKTQKKLLKCPRFIFDNFSYHLNLSCLMLLLLLLLRCDHNCCVGWIRIDSAVRLPVVLIQFSFGAESFSACRTRIRMITGVHSEGNVNESHD